MNIKFLRNFLLSILIGFVFLLTVSACTSPGAGGGEFASIPVGKAYADGQEIYFMHTEASDPEIAEKLTNMMKSPVLLVPSLAQAPDTLVANVYVFSNGVKGKGPLGYQPDVFDNPPEREGYTPLRRMNVVTWIDERKAREVKAATDILSAQKAGEVTIEQPGVVINMPFVTWQNGKR